MRSLVYIDNITITLSILYKDYPNVSIGIHISNALDGQELYTTSDKDLSEALTKYINDLKNE